jgi:hypothetical protein
VANVEIDVLERLEPAGVGLGEIGDGNDGLHVAFACLHERNRQGELCWNIRCRQEFGGLWSPAAPEATEITVDQIRFGRYRFASVVIPSGLYLLRSSRLDSSFAASPHPNQ